MYLHILLLILTLKRSFCNDEDKPVIDALIVSPNLSEGKKFFLTCHANTEKSSITSFDWLLNGKSILPNDNVVIKQYEENSILTIKSMSGDFNGEFACLTKNSYGEDSRTVSVKLNIKPRFLIEPTNIYAKLNSLLNTKCQVTAIPLANIKWIKLSSNGEEEMTIENDELRFNFTKSDASSYKCVAENQLGRIEKIIQIKYYGNNSFCSKFF